MPYTDPNVLTVLQKYRVADEQGNLRMSPIRRNRPNAQPVPVLSADVIDKLVASDPTPDKRWLDWIFYQAGGGDTAKNMAKQALDSIKQRFIDERVNGWTQPVTGQYQNPVPRAEAVARWERAEPKFRDVLLVSDEDTVKKLRTFGFYREWPGNANVYANVVDAMNAYMKVFKLLEKMNTELVREGGEQLPTTPDGIPTFSRMKEIAQKVERYYASKKARSDIREQTIYDDDVITALAPLTYAAAVKYGYDQWPWASRKGFEAVLAGDPGNWRTRDEWKANTSRGTAIVYLTFHTPVPAWIVRRDGAWDVKDLTDLALHLEPSDAKENPDTWQVYDQENQNTRTLAQIKQMILSEPTRTDAEEDEVPIKRGANVYKTTEEAQHVVNSLDRAVNAVQKWLAKFDMKAVKSDVFTLD
jgi:hypothetical protein